MKPPLRGALDVARLTGHHDLPISAIHLVDDQARRDPPPIRDRALGAPAEDEDFQAPRRDTRRNVLWPPPRARNGSGELSPGAMAYGCRRERRRRGPSGSGPATRA